MSESVFSYELGWLLVRALRCGVPMAAQHVKKIRQGRMFRSALDVGQYVRGFCAAQRHYNLRAQGQLSLYNDYD